MQEHDTFQEADFILSLQKEKQTISNSEIMGRDGEEEEGKNFSLIFPPLKDFYNFIPPWIKLLQEYLDH